MQRHAVSSARVAVENERCDFWGEGACNKIHAGAGTLRINAAVAHMKKNPRSFYQPVMEIFLAAATWLGERTS